jgi:peptidoglycan/xylan/chitin deacetylase (PgdA/CDA1 family)
VATSGWPNDAPFALFLSHDVDQVHDRGVFRTLGDVNHLRRVLISGEAGDIKGCRRRIVRSLFRPKDWRPQFERVLEIEAAFGWRSTFFVLEGYRWSRYGSRYRLEDRRIQSLAAMLIAGGSEIGVHGAYHDFNSAVGYRRSADRIEAAFGVRPVGIRNHFLRFSFPQTWKAQADAGFLYDATFGWNDRIGPQDDRWWPFEAHDPDSGEAIGLTVLPLTIMDTTLFRQLKLDKAGALACLDETFARAAATGGLVTLLWHNNYFDEPEYADWEEVYTEGLRRAAEYRPYCATGAEIAMWWRTNASPSGV